MMYNSKKSCSQETFHGFKWWIGSRL